MANYAACEQRQKKDPGVVDFETTCPQYLQECLTYNKTFMNIWTNQN